VLCSGCTPRFSCLFPLLGLRARATFCRIPPTPPQSTDPPASPPSGSNTYSQPADSLTKTHTPAPVESGYGVPQYVLEPVDSSKPSPVDEVVDPHAPAAYFLAAGVDNDYGVPQDSDKTALTSRAGPPKAPKPPKPTPTPRTSSSTRERTNTNEVFMSPMAAAKTARASSLTGKQ
jgi:hypothetical protein